MTFGGALFSNSSDELADQNAWRTPPEVWEPLFDHFNFGLDAAADCRNHLCDRWLGVGSPLYSDALAAHWHAFIPPQEDVWNNPPYGRGVGKWVEHAAESGQYVRVVQLIFARTDTLWWHDVVLERAVEIVHLRGRVTFLGTDGQPLRDSKGRVQTATAPSALVIFQPHDELTPAPSFSAWEPGTQFHQRRRYPRYNR